MIVEFSVYDTNSYTIEHLLDSKENAELIEQFKIEKLQRYHNHLKAFSELQKDNNNILDDLWECVSRDRNLAMGTNGNNTNNS